MYKLRSVSGNLTEGMRISIQKHYNTEDNTMTRTLTEFDLRTPIVCSRGRLERIIYATYDIEIYDLTHVSTLLYATHEPIIKGQSTMYKTYYIAVKYNTRDEKKQICEDLTNNLHYEQNLLEIFGFVEPTPVTMVVDELWDTLTEPVPVDTIATETTPPERPFTFNIENAITIETLNYSNGLLRRDYVDFVSAIRNIKLNISDSWLRSNATLSEINFTKCTFGFSSSGNKYIGRYFEVKGFPFILYLHSKPSSLEEVKDIKLLTLENRFLSNIYTNYKLEQIRIKFKEKYNVKELTHDSITNSMSNKIFRNSLLLYNKVGSDANYFNSSIDVSSQFTLKNLLLDGSYNFSYRMYENYTDNLRYANSFNCDSLLGSESTQILHKKFRDQEEERDKKYVLIKEYAEEKYFYFEFKSNILVSFLVFFEYPSLFLMYNSLFIKNDNDFSIIQQVLRDEFYNIVNVLAVDGIFSHFYKKY